MLSMCFITASRRMLRSGERLLSHRVRIAVVRHELFSTVREQIVVCSALENCHGRIETAFNLPAQLGASGLLLRGRVLNKVLKAVDEIADQQQLEGRTRCGFSLQPWRLVLNAVTLLT